MELVPINERIEENEYFVTHPDCKESLEMTITYYKSVGFSPPWISYYVRQNDQLVGAAAFKGRPLGGKVEIAYGTFGKYQNQGIGAAICKELVNLSLQTDPSVRITARTLPEKNFSCKILEKNGFAFKGTVIDTDDGEVWEWEFATL